MGKSTARGKRENVEGGHLVEGKSEKIRNGRRAPVTKQRRELVQFWSGNSKIKVAFIRSLRKTVIACKGEGQSRQKN